MRMMIDQYEDLLKRAVELEDDLLKLLQLPQEYATRRPLETALDSMGDVVGDIGWIIDALKGQ